MSLDALYAMSAIDWLGVLGSLIIAGAYFAVSGGWAKADRPAFQLFNLVGAGLILLSLYYRPNPGAIVMESLWVLIGIYGLVRYFRHRP